MADAHPGALALSSDYERELRGLLGGDDAVVTRMVKRVERADPKGALRLRTIRDNPFLVLRAAGSLGVDLVALRGEVSFPIEVKTSNEDVVRLSRSRQTKEQARDLTRTCLRAGLVPLYAYRRRDMRDGDPWRIFLLTTERLESEWGEMADQGNLVSHTVYRKLVRAGAQADVTDQGNYILRWHEGWPLFEFVGFLGDWVDRRSRGPTDRRGRRDRRPAAGSGPA